MSSKPTVSPLLSLILLLPFLKYLSISAFQPPPPTSRRNRIIISPRPFVINKNPFRTDVPSPKSTPPRSKVTPTPSSPWSRTAEIQHDDDDDEHLQIVRLYDPSNFHDDDRPDSDLTSPREWMEHLARTEGGTGGAYTVLRCDVKPPHGDDGGERAVLWGREFHLDRLTTSYGRLVPTTNGSGDDDDDDDDGSRRTETRDAVVRSERMIRSLIDGAIYELDRVHRRSSSSCGEDGMDVSVGDLETKVIMITLLWTPTRTSATATTNDEDGEEEEEEEWGRIVVRGHVSCSNFGEPYSSPMKNLSDVPPMNVAIALPETCVRGTAGLDGLPSRYDDRPEAKLSSWCTSRRPLEETFKLAGIGEVLLARPIRKLDDDDDYDDDDNSGTWELLEGLTSNLFILYYDGTLHTAKEGVLGGYARSLVLEAARKNGIEIVMDRPIRIEDGERGLWREVFVTSSIRLIVPVEKVFLPEHDREEGVSFREIVSIDQGEGQVWKMLYKDVMDRSFDRPSLSDDE